jgi:hypothetical protein
LILAFGSITSITEAVIPTFFSAGFVVVVFLTIGLVLLSKYVSYAILTGIKRRSTLQGFSEKHNMKVW